MEWRDQDSGDKGDADYAECKPRQMDQIVNTEDNRGNAMVSYGIVGYGGLWGFLKVGRLDFE